MRSRHDNQYYLFGALFLAIGDVLTLLLFTFFGTLEHQMDAGLRDMLRITLPFILGWIAVGLLTGAYRSKAYSAAVPAAAAVIRTAVLAVPLALLLRWLLEDKPSTLTFGLVSFAFVILFLTLWRWTYTWLIRNL